MESPGLPWSPPQSPAPRFHFPFGATLQSQPPPPINFTSAGAPRFLKYAGLEAPKMTDLAPTRVTKTWPLHAKDVAASINLAQLRVLGRESPALLDALKWLDDPSRYHKLLRNGPPTRNATSTLTTEDMTILVDLRKYDLVDETEVKAFCNAFTIPEYAKIRRRHIIEPIINDLIKDAHGEVKLPTKSDVSSGLRRYSILLDAASFFDQFGLSTSVSKFFCVRHGTQLYSFKTLPMGFKKSCLVAQLTAQELLKFHTPGVFKVAYIDNFMFSADTIPELLKAVKQFRERCKLVGVILNAYENSLGDDQNILQSFDFLGCHYNTTAEDRTLWTRTNTKKTLDKLQAAVNLLEATRPLTWRQQAAIYGILFFAESTAPLPGVGLSEYFDALHHLRSNVATTTAWNKRAPPLKGTVLSQLSAWSNEALKNTPFLFNATNKLVPDIDIFVDASSAGWGAVIRSSTGVAEHRGTWTPEDAVRWNLQSSVATEPLAMRKAILAVHSSVHTPNNAYIRVHVDHQGLAFAFGRGHSRVASYNEAIRYVKSLLPPSTVVEVFFVAGVDNGQADRLSRWDKTTG